MTSPVTPPDSERLPTSPTPPDPDCLPPGVTESFDCFLDCQSLIEQATDLSPPLIPLPDNLLPMSVPMTPSPGHSSPVVSAPVDLSREGPSDAFCVPSDTGGHTLIVEGLPGCPYRMTSYREESPPTFPRVYQGTRVSSLIGSVSGGVDPYDGQTGRYIGSLTATARCWPDGIQSSSLRTVCDVAQPDVIGSYAFGTRYALGPEIFPSEVINVIAPVPRIHRAATHMSAMSLWRPPVGPGAPGPMPGYSYK